MRIIYKEYVASESVQRLVLLVFFNFTVIPLGRNRLDMLFGYQGLPGACLPGQLVRGAIKRMVCGTLSQNIRSGITWVGVSGLRF